MTKINTMMYISSVMLLLYITMKINSSGKERSHKLLQANCHISLLFMVFFNDVHCILSQYIIVLYIRWIIMLFVFLFLLLLLLLFIFRHFVRFLFIQCIYWRRNVRIFYWSKQNRFRWIYRIKRACLWWCNICSWG